MERCNICLGPTPHSDSDCIAAVSAADVAFASLNDKRCRWCGSEGLSACSVCNTVVYCDRDCQKSDWTRAHKAACKLFAHRFFHELVFDFASEFADHRCARGTPEWAERRLKCLKVIFNGGNMGPVIGFSAYTLVRADDGTVDILQLEPISSTSEPLAPGYHSNFKG